MFLISSSFYEDERVQKNSLTYSNELLAENIHKENSCEYYFIQILLKILHLFVNFVHSRKKIY